MKVFKETATCIRGVWYVMAVLKEEFAPGKFADLSGLESLSKEWKDWMGRVERNGEKVWGWGDEGDYFTGPIQGILRLKGPLEPDHNQWGEVSL